MCKRPLHCGLSVLISRLKDFFSAVLLYYKEGRKFPTLITLQVHEPVGSPAPPALSGVFLYMITSLKIKNLVSQKTKLVFIHQDDVLPNSSNILPNHVVYHLWSQIQGSSSYFHDLYLYPKRYINNGHYPFL
jgi:hypothetical protein